MIRMLELFNCEQGTDEWFELRRIPTASNFGTVKAKGTGGKESKTRRKYMAQLVAERITGKPGPGWGSNAHTERGHELEPEARNLYAFQTGNEVELIGFIRNGNKGVSPDGVIGESGLLEIKTKLPEIQIDVLDRNAMPVEHKPQVQGALWVAEREWCDFVSYWPGLPIFIQRQYRDEVYIQSLAEEVELFIEEMLELEQFIRRRYW